jgi:hypothetical protein
MMLFNGISPSPLRSADAKNRLLWSGYEMGIAEGRRLTCLMTLAANSDCIVSPLSHIPITFGLRAFK